MHDFTVNEILLAVKAFKNVRLQAYHHVKHYHSDNGAFAHKSFMEEVNRKNQKLTFCVVDAHHQNGTIENKNKMLTLSACTLLLRGMRMWPQINKMFWPFAFKAAAELCLSLNKDGQTPISILHSVPSNTVPFKPFHTLFCPVYVLDLHIQSAGNPGPPKWEPQSCISVYLGHSPFHAGNMALIFNPRTGHILPQYHMVFDDTFLTIPFMDAGMVPPHWADQGNYFTKRATNKEFNLAEEWMKEMPDHVDISVAGSRLTDSFALIPDQNQAHTLASDTTTPEALVHDSSPSLEMIPASERANKCTLGSASSTMSTAAPLSRKARKLTTHNITRIHQSYDFDSPTPVDSSSSQLTFPPRINLHEAGPCISPRLLELARKATCSRKAHVTWSKSLPKLVSLFTLF
jgi:hypothetical protein